MVKKVRKFEKFDFKYRKALLDLEFLHSCKKEKLIPKLLHFKVSNKRLESSDAYLSCQRHLLKQEISIKYSSHFEQKKYVKHMQNDLKFQKVYIDHDKILNHLIHMANRVTDVLKSLRDKRETSIE